MPALAAAITAPPTSSVRRSTTSCATPALPASPPWPAIATASGPASSAKALPPAAFEPVGVAFITGSISAPGLWRRFEHRFPKDHPLRALFRRRAAGRRRQAAGRRSTCCCITACAAASNTRAAATSRQARRLSNPELAPHLPSSTWAATATAVVRADERRDRVRVRVHPAAARARATGADGGPLRYRVVHRARLWRAGERRVLEQRVLEGDVALSI